MSYKATCPVCDSHTSQFYATGFCPAGCQKSLRTEITYTVSCECGWSETAYDSNEVHTLKTQHRCGRDSYPSTITHDARRRQLQDELAELG